ncbi:MAG: DUF1080 domain-containing protein [Phycisphaera sp.]|nr:DUF1080 domain-containing protein [Phycisphaera sp.]
MPRNLTIAIALLAFAAAVPALAAEDNDKTWIDPDVAAKENEDFRVQGEYLGEKVGAQVIALGDGKFRVVTYEGGLPGKGMTGKTATVEGDAAKVKELTEDKGMKHIKRVPPSLGAKPPAGAIHLFDGTKESLEKHWKPGAKITDEGLLEQGATSIDLFQNCTIHVEFRTPFKPFARGQGRGNSGLYVQGRYETQVLDSFGLEGKMNETGGIYSVKDPDLNMCLPPLTWQTYDVEFTAAKFEDGKKVANARLTVFLNGVVVQDNVEADHSTTASPLKEGPEPGPIYLQNHGNPVRFRNVWVLPKD